MTRLAYRIDCASNLRRVGKTSMTDAQVTAALSKFRDDLLGYFAGDPSDSLKTEPVRLERKTGLLVAETTLGEAAIENAVRTCVESHNRNAMRIPGL